MTETLAAREELIRLLARVLESPVEQIDRNGVGHLIYGLIAGGSARGAQVWSEQIERWLRLVPARPLSQADLRDLEEGLKACIDEIDRVTALLRERQRPG